MDPCMITASRAMPARGVWSSCALARALAGGREAPPDKQRPPEPQPRLLAACSSMMLLALAPPSTWRDTGFLYTSGIAACVWHGMLRKAAAHQHAGVGRRQASRPAVLHLQSYVIDERCGLQLTCLSDKILRLFVVL